ncbi:MAG: hypothetical protein JWN03_6002 [Nocardia sp.]|nr:hypothetical protein [Nocardia sp.]
MTGFSFATGARVNENPSSVRPIIVVRAHPVKICAAHQGFTDV